MEIIIQFLLKNGFTKIGEGIYMNLKCIVTIHVSNYEIEFPKGEGKMFSPDLNIYWLIGLLTYYKLINRDYTLPHE